jgi:hypothetical protein
MVISALVNFVQSLAAMLVPAVPADRLSDPQILRAVRRVRYAKKLAEDTDKVLGAEIRTRLGVRPVTDATGDAKLVTAHYRTYNVEDAIRVLVANRVPLAGILTVKNGAIEALPAEILAQVSYVETVSDRLLISGKGMDERE